jgi:hypothetical protein
VVDFFSQLPFLASAARLLTIEHIKDEFLKTAGKTKRGIAPVSMTIQLFLMYTVLISTARIMLVLPIRFTTTLSDLIATE